MAKIAYLTPLYFSDESYIGGGERYPLNLARGVVAASAGADSVDLISFGPTARSYAIEPGLTVKVLQAARPPLNSLDVVSWDLPAAIADADLIHIHQAYTRCSEMALLIAKQQGKAIVVTDHGGTTSSLGTSVGALELADQVVAYSDFGASLYRTKLPISIVRGGVDGSHFTPSATPVERDRVLYVGRLLPHKGIDQLINATPADIPLTICGRVYHPEYFEVLKSLCAGKTVHFITDATDDHIRTLYRRAWVNVLPSVYRDYYGNMYLSPELMGFTLLEAMACGTPAICSNVAAMPEYVQDGETGFVYDDLATLTARLRQLAADPALVARLGVAARRKIETDYDYRVAGAKLIAIYAPLIARCQGVAA